jgi:hypothetical protein
MTAILTTATTACGGGEESEADRVEAAVEELQRAYADGDARKACAAMTFDVQLEVGSSGHNAPSLCPRDLRRAWRYLRDERERGYATPPGVTTVRVDGNRATVTIEPVHDATTRVAMVEDRGRWKLASFYGTVPSTREDAAPPRPGDGAAVMPVASGGRPCARVDTGDTARIRGGCGIEARGKMTMIVRTAFGAFRFARCGMRLVVRIDGRGRTWTKPLGISNNGVCGDVDFCIDKRNVRRPWLGEIRRTRGLEHRVNLCFRTCIGQFQGEVAMDLRDDRNGWRIEATDRTLGVGGLEIDGRWQARAPNVDIRG